VTEIQEGETVWNYRIVRRTCNDGAIYGMHEAYYNRHLTLQGWTENPYWTEQEPSDFTLTLDLLEGDFKRSKKKAGWALGYDGTDYLMTLGYMRQAVSKPVIDEEKELGKWDDD